MHWCNAIKFLKLDTTIAGLIVTTKFTKYTKPL